MTIKGLVARTVVTTMLVTAGLVGATGVAQADGGYWAAIALSGRTYATGYSWDHPTAGRARAAAVGECHRSDCRTIVVVQNGCAALAQAPNGALGWAYGASLDAARRAAVRATPASGSRAIGWVCTTGHR